MVVILSHWSAFTCVYGTMQTDRRRWVSHKPVQSAAISVSPGPRLPSQLQNVTIVGRQENVETYYAPVCPSVRLSVPRRSCLGYRHAGWLPAAQPPPAVRAVGTADPSADGRRSATIFGSNCHRRGHIVSQPPGRYLVTRAGRLQV